jgi:phosphoribosylformimino-5-aminoimidazole carboxamide ribotide isomerase
MAREFESYGLHRLHLVDLDGARASAVKNWNILERIAGETKLSIDFSGGIKSREDVQKAFEGGAAFVSLGSVAVKQPELVKEWLDEFGTERFIIGADVKNDKIMIHGWHTETEWRWQDLIGKYMGWGLSRFFCTDISKDGLLTGPALDLYGSILRVFPSVKLIASGGVSTTKDLEELRSLGCEGAIVGKAIYEKKISLEELKIFNESC